MPDWGFRHNHVLSVLPALLVDSLVYTLALIMEVVISIDARKGNAGYSPGRKYGPDGLLVLLSKYLGFVL